MCRFGFSKYYNLNQVNIKPQKTALAGLGSVKVYLLEHVGFTIAALDLKLCI